MNWSLIILNATLLALSLTLLGYLLSRETTSHDGFGALSWILSLAAIIQVTTVSDWLDNWKYILAGCAVAFLWGFARVAYSLKINTDEKALKKIVQSHIQYNKELYAYIAGAMSKEELLSSVKVLPSEMDWEAEERISWKIEERIRLIFFKSLNNIADTYAKNSQTSPIKLEVNPEAYSLLENPGNKEVELFKAKIDADAVIGSSFTYGLAAPFSILNATLGRFLRYVVIDILYTRYLQEIQKIAQKWFKDLFKF